MIDTSKFPQKEEIFSWIKDLTQWGHRKTGTVEGEKSALYIATKMKEFGMSDVRIETVPSMCMFVDAHELEIDGEKIENFYINGTNKCSTEGGVSFFGENNSKQEFIYIGEGSADDFTKIDVSGKIAVSSINLLTSDAGVFMDWFEKFDVYDPENKLQKPLKKSDIYSPCNFPANYFMAMNHGAIGFIGILENYMDDPYLYNEDYDDLGQEFGTKLMKIPGLFISRSSGKKLKKKFGDKAIAGKASDKILAGCMKVKSTYKYADAKNISGILEGESDDYIVIHSHHDAVFEGAVQDASGISEMLAIGKYFSQIPKGQRKKTMMFVATDTHYTDYEAHKQFIRERCKEGVNMILDLAIEHIGKEAGFDDDWNLVETGDVEARLVYISEESGLYDTVIKTFKKYGLDKTMFAATHTGDGLDTEYVFHQDEVISDAYYFNESGIPVVSMVCGEQYLFHPSDTVERIPLDQLEPVGMAFAEIALKAAEVL